MSYYYDYTEDENFVDSEDYEIYNKDAKSKDFLKQVFGLNSYNHKTMKIIEKIFYNSKLLNEFNEEDNKYDFHEIIKMMNDKFDEYINFKLLYKFYDSNTYSENHINIKLTIKEILKLMKVLKYISSDNLIDVILMGFHKNNKFYELYIRDNDEFDDDMKSVFYELYTLIDVNDILLNSITFNGTLIHEIFLKSFVKHIKAKNGNSQYYLTESIKYKRYDLMKKLIEHGLTFDFSLNSDIISNINDSEILSYLIKNLKDIQIDNNIFAVSIINNCRNSAKFFKDYPRHDELENRIFNYSMKLGDIDNVKYVVSLGYKPNNNHLLFQTRYIDPAEFNSVYYAIKFAKRNNKNLINFILDLNAEVPSNIFTQCQESFLFNNELMKPFIDHGLMINDFFQYIILDNGDIEMFDYIYDKLSYSTEELFSLLFFKRKCVGIIKKYFFDKGYEHTDKDFEDAIRIGNVPLVKLLCKEYNKRKNKD